MLLNIICHLNEVSKTACFEDENIIKEKMLQQSKNICPDISESDISMENSSKGLNCIVSCPKCHSETKLSSYTNKKTGTSSFTIFNFSRHYRKLHDQQKTISNPNLESNGNASTSAVVNMVSNACQSCESLSSSLNLKGIF